MSNDQISSSFLLLNKKIQEWIWEQNWTELRDIQETSIKAILSSVTLLRRTAKRLTNAHVDSLL